MSKSLKNFITIDVSVRFYTHSVNVTPYRKFCKGTLHANCAWPS